MFYLEVNKYILEPKKNANLFRKVIEKFQVSMSYQILKNTPRRGIEPRSPA
jgi:hypothetical protein